jgi:signal transduction histidine kinase
MPRLTAAAATPTIPGVGFLDTAVQRPPPRRMPTAHRRSGFYAAALALAYVALAMAYIWLSSAWAADAATTVAELWSVETLKGMVFVAATGALAFGGALVAMRRLERMAHTLAEQQHALVANESRITAGLMAASVAHDANNVLTVALAELDELARGGGGEAVQRIEQLMTRLVALNRRLVDTAQQGGKEPAQRIELAEVANEMVVALRTRTTARRCRLRVVVDGPCPVLGQRLVLQRILGNLVLNAIEAAPVGGEVEIRLSTAAGERWLEVHDNGAGVPPAQRAELFHALRTTKSHGSGLGLFSVRVCAHGLGGEVEVGDSPLGGALFRVRLPAAPDG